MTILIDYLTLVLDSRVRQFLGVWEIKPDVAKRAVERGSFFFRSCFCSVKKYVTLALVL